MPIGFVDEAITRLGGLCDQAVRLSNPSLDLFFFLYKYMQRRILVGKE